MLRKYVVQVSDEDIDRLLELADMGIERYPSDTYENAVMCTIDWLFQLDYFDAYIDELVLAPIPLDEENEIN